MSNRFMNEALDQRSVTYGSFQDNLWLSGSQTNLSSNFFKVLQSSEYHQNGFLKLWPPLSSLGVDRALTKLASNQKTMKFHEATISNCMALMGMNSKT